MVFQVGCSLQQAALITSLEFITLEVDNQRRYPSWSLTLCVMRLFEFYKIIQFIKLHLCTVCNTIQQPPQCVCINLEYCKFLILLI